MHLKAARSILAGIAAVLLLSACGKNSGGPQQSVNIFPVANAGSPQAVISGATVTLNGAASSDADGSVVSHSWTQTAGPNVSLTNATSAQASFVAPQVTTAVTLRFSLVVTDDRGAKSSAATVNVTVSSSSAGLVTLTGTVRFARVPFLSGSPFGLDYANPVLQPAREVAILVLDAASLDPLPYSGKTDANGAYSIGNVPGDANVVLQVEARMQHDSGPSGPRWNVRVQDGNGILTPYRYNSPAFNSSAGSQNIDIPLGISPTGTAIGGQQRASGPFAILDTIYTAMQAVVAVAPNTIFPTLYVNWGSQSQGTFFSPNSQSIALLADLTEDTDEFDQHVVAHEFGHYIENNFSRSDSIGGPHGLGDRLDMRVAFGEGFGYAFAAIVLDNSVALDSFFNGSSHVASGFDVEVNPPGGGSGAGCWCSETSVWSMLWDLHDATADGSDNIQIGFAPIWQVLTGPQRTTPAMTSIFSFAEALKAARPADAAGIDALLVAQNIDAAGINAFATTETHEPIGGLTLVPLYPTITPGNPVVVRNAGVRTPERLYNKAGNRSFLRFTPATGDPVNITVVTSNTNGAPATADPDFLVYRSGNLVAVEQDSPDDEPVRTETGVLSVTAGQTYIIEAYDCANGCAADPVQGIAGDYTLTVTIN